MKEMSEGSDLLLDDSCSLDYHFGHCTSLYQNFRGFKVFTHGFQSARSAKVSSCENLYVYSIKTVFYVLFHCYD